MDNGVCLYYKLTYEPKGSDELIKAYFHFSHYKSMETIRCHSDVRKHMSNGNKKHNFVEVNVMNISAKFQLHRPTSEKIFYYFFSNLAFQLPWQPIKFSSLEKINKVGNGLPKEHFCKTFVKISAVR